MDISCWMSMPSALGHLWSALNIVSTASPFPHQISLMPTCDTWRVLKRTISFNLLLFFTPILFNFALLDRLADFALFRQFITEKLSLPQSTRWIAFGGSYSGALSAWFRLKVAYLFLWLREWQKMTNTCLVSTSHSRVFSYIRSS